MRYITNTMYIEFLLEKICIFFFIGRNQKGLCLWRQSSWKDHIKASEIKILNILLIFKLTQCNLSFSFIYDSNQEAFFRIKSVKININISFSFTELKFYHFIICSSKFLCDQKQLHTTNDMAGFLLHWFLLFNHKMESCYRKRVNQSLWTTHT